MQKGWISGAAESQELSNTLAFVIVQVHRTHMWRKKTIHLEQLCLQRKWTLLSLDLVWIKLGHASELCHLILDIK